MPCASRLRRGRLTAHPCADSRRARILRAPLRAIFAEACDARHRERRQEHSFSRPSMDYVAPRLSLLFLVQLWSAGCALLPIPFALRRQRPRRPKGRRDGSRRFRCVHRDVHSAEHRPRPRTFRAGARKAQCQGRVLLGYFLLHEQEKVTRSPKGRVKALALKTRNNAQNHPAVSTRISPTTAAFGPNRRSVSTSEPSSRAYARVLARVP